MMTYEMFKETFAEEFLKFMPEEYQHMEPVVNRAHKVNQELDSLTLKDPNAKLPTVGPTLYINGYYEDYKITNDINAVLQKAASIMADAYKEMPDMVPELDYATAKDNIVFQLINTVQNEELLKTLPHREIEDLSIVYRWIIGLEEDSSMGALVTHGLAGTLDLTEDKLFELATENTKRIIPPKVDSMQKIMTEMLMGVDGEEDLLDELLDMEYPDKDMYVITNEYKHLGASSILYDEPLQEVANRVKEDLYILPSSIHEIIVVPVSMGDPNTLAEMVSEINEDKVAPEERLSDNVYFYDKTQHTITLANEKESLLDKLKVAAQELEASVGREKPVQRENSFAL